MSASDVLKEATAAAVPAVFRGLNSSWPAVHKWDGPAGLRYLQAQAGDADVQVYVYDVHARFHRIYPGALAHYSKSAGCLLVKCA
jgi:hypothetical protein